MTYSLVQPLGQKLLSNVSVIKLDRRGKHFEIAVFPNKVSSWRNGLEDDLDNVVQSHSIFVNVDQGMLAKQTTIFEALQVKTMDEALKLILQEGKLSLAEKERKIVIANLTKDIASIVASQCVNTNTQRPLTPTMVERAMKTIGFSVKLTARLAGATSAIETEAGSGFAGSDSDLRHEVGSRAVSAAAKSTKIFFIFLYN